MPRRTQGSPEQQDPVSEVPAAQPAPGGTRSPFETLFENAPVGIVIVDWEGHSINANPAFLRMFGYSAEELRLLTPSDLTYPEDLAADLELYEQMLRGERDHYRMEKRYVRRDGSLMWARLTASIIRSESGKPGYGVSVVEDITERKQADELLRRANRALRVLSECNEALVRARDESSLLADVCRTIVEIGGYQVAWVGYAEQDAGKSVRPVAQAGLEQGYLEKQGITWADEPRGRGPLGTAIRTEQRVIERNIPDHPADLPWREEAIRRDLGSSAAFPLLAAGKCFGALNVYAPEMDAFDDEELELLSRLAADVAYGVLALRARADLRETVDALSRTDQVRRMLLSRLVNAQEEERRRVAADIHDDTIQAMTAVGLRLGALGPLVGDEPAARKLLGELDDSVTNAVSRLRHLLFKLRPPALDHPGGLRACLREDLARLREEAGMSAELKEAVTGQISSESRIIAYRIAQEALANVRKHARASTVEVLVASQDGGLLVRIQDDGVGFDPGESAGDAAPEHLGLTSMRERAEFAGGWFRLRSAPGEGTVVEFWVPSALPTP